MKQRRPASSFAVMAELLAALSRLTQALRPVLFAGGAVLALVATADWFRREGIRLSAYLASGSGSDRQRPLDRGSDALG